MDRVSDDELDMLINKWADPVQALEEGLLELPALTELRERRAAEKAPCPKHARMVAEWDTYEMGRDDSSAAPYWCQLYKDGMLKGQGIGMTMEDAIRQAAENSD